MFRYIAMFWNPESHDETSVALTLAKRLLGNKGGWTETLSGNGARVLCAGSIDTANGAACLSRSGGVLLGTVFRRTDATSLDVPQRVRFFSEDESSAIAGSRGRVLIDNYWGRYVAIVLDRTSGAIRVIKDPTGGLPCYYCTWRGITIFFSSLSDCLALGAMQFRINWRYVAGRVAFGGNQANGTGLEGIHEVYGGECITLERNGLSRSFYWKPFDIAKSGFYDDAEFAARRIRQAVRASTHAWATCHQSILHTLSGGLDSSIVLACLKDAPHRPRITCVTFYLDGSHFDERPWARIAAQVTPCQHVEQPRTDQIAFDALLNIQPSVSPYPDLAFLERAGLLNRLITGCSATAIFDGDGGDALFGGVTHWEAARDFVRTHGLNPKLLRVALNVALLVDASLWKVLRDAIRVGLRRRRVSVEELILQHRKLPSRTVLDAVGADSTIPHPWFADTEGIARGTIYPLVSVAWPRMYYNPLRPVDEFEPEVVSPVLAQPMVEVALRIPSFLHVVGAQDRALARRAFASDMPHEIVKRQWKDRAAGFFDRVLRNNLGLVREVLLDGTLVKRGFVDRSALESALSTMPSRSTGYTLEIFDLLLTETWIGCQSRYSQTRVAA